jgi:hypothetical protein
MQNLHRYLMGAALGIVLSIAGCINLPGPGDRAGNCLSAFHRNSCKYTYTCSIDVHTSTILNDSSN